MKRQGDGGADFLRLHIPVGTLSGPQRARAVALGNRIESHIAHWLSNGADPDRLMEKVEGFFP